MKNAKELTHEISAALLNQGIIWPDDVENVKDIILPIIETNK